MTAFEITKPGMYVMRNGRMFVVKCVDWPGPRPIVGHVDEFAVCEFRCKHGFVCEDKVERGGDIVAKYEEPEVDLKQYVGKVVYFEGEKYNAARLVVWASDVAVGLAGSEGVHEHKRDDFLKQYKLAEDSK